MENASSSRCEPAKMFERINSYRLQQRLLPRMNARRSCICWTALSKASISRRTFLPIRRIGNCPTFLTAEDNSRLFVKKILVVVHAPCSKSIDKINGSLCGFRITAGDRGREGLSGVIPPAFNVPSIFVALYHYG